MKLREWMTRICAGAVVVLLVACGGGGGTSTPAGPSLSGLAATGAAVHGRIFLKDAAGHELQTDTVDGTFSFALTGLTAPYLLRAQWDAGSGVQRLYSFASGPGTANITPLSQMVVSAAAGTTALDALYDGANASRMASLASALPGASASLQSSLKTVLAQYSVAGLDLISGQFSADHTGLDALLDNVSLSVEANTVTLKRKLGGAVVSQANVLSPDNTLSSPGWDASQAAAAGELQLAIDSSGNSLLVWSEKVAGSYVIRAQMTRQGVVTLATLSKAGNAGVPQVSFDAVGNAMVIWAQGESPRNDVWASRWTVKDALWSVPVSLSNSITAPLASGPSLAMDAAGHAIVAWSQTSPGTNHFDVWLANFSASTGTWSAPSLVSDGVHTAYTPRVALNASGQGMLAWVQGQDDGSSSNGPADVWARSVSSSGTQGSSRQINALGGQTHDVYGQLDLALDLAGNALLLWVQTGPSLPYVIHASRHDAVLGWQADEVISHHVLDNNYGPHVAFDDAGNAIAVWEQQTGTGSYAAANRYVLGTGWGDSVALADATEYGAHDVRVAVDGLGHGIAIWYQSTPTADTVMFARWQPTLGWSVADVFGAPPTAGTLGYPVPRVASNRAGQSLAAWGMNSM